MGAGDVVIESGDGTGAVGSIVTEASFYAPDIDMTFRTNGTLHLDGLYSVAAITLDAGGAITQAPNTSGRDDLAAGDGIDVRAGGPVTLQGDNSVGVLSLHTTSSAPVAVHVVDPMALTSSSVGGPLTILADDGIDLDSTITTGGTTVLVADDDAPPSPRIGTGDITAEPGTVIDAGGHPVQLYSATRDLGDIAPDLTINGARYRPGTAWVTTAGEAWATRWNAAAALPTVTPFQFVFEPGDLVAPTASLDLPAGVPIYTLNQVVHVTASCADTGGSGLASCVTTGLRPGDFLETGVYGEHFITVTATDGTGNRSVLTRKIDVRPGPRAPRVCVPPTTATLKLARPKRVRSVVATLSRVRQSVRLTRTQIVITVNVRGRPVGQYPLKVTLRRRAGLRTVTRRPKVIVYRCTRR